MSATPLNPTILQCSRCVSTAEIFGGGCKSFVAVIYYRHRKENSNVVSIVEKPTKRTPSRELGVQTFNESISALQMSGNCRAVCVYFRPSSHLQTKYRITPAVTSAATVTKNVVSIALTSFPTIKRGTTYATYFSGKFFAGQVYRHATTDNLRRLAH